MVYFIIAIIVLLLLSILPVVGIGAFFTDIRYWFTSKEKIEEKYKSYKPKKEPVSQVGMMIASKLGGTYNHEQHCKEQDQHYKSVARATTYSDINQREKSKIEGFFIMFSPLIFILLAYFVNFDFFYFYVYFLVYAITLWFRKTVEISTTLTEYDIKQSTVYTTIIVAGIITYLLSMPIDFIHESWINVMTKP